MMPERCAISHWFIHYYALLVRMMDNVAVVNPVVCTWTSSERRRVIHGVTVEEMSSSSWRMPRTAIGVITLRYASSRS